MKLHFNSSNNNHAFIQPLDSESCDPFSQQTFNSIIDCKPAFIASCVFDDGTVEHCELAGFTRHCKDALESQNPNNYRISPLSRRQWTEVFISYFNPKSSTLCTIGNKDDLILYSSILCKHNATENADTVLRSLYLANLKKRSFIKTCQIVACISQRTLQDNFYAAFSAQKAEQGYCKEEVKELHDRVVTDPNFDTLYFEMKLAILEGYQKLNYHEQYILLCDRISKQSDSPEQLRQLLHLSLAAYHKKTLEEHAMQQS